jgi:hypothetical protein
LILRRYVALMRACPPLCILYNINALMVKRPCWRFRGCGHISIYRKEVEQEQ